MVRVRIKKKSQNVSKIILMCTYGNLVFTKDLEAGNNPTSVVHLTAFLQLHQQVELWWLPWHRRCSNSGYFLST